MLRHVNLAWKLDLIKIRLLLNSFDMFRQNSQWNGGYNSLVRMPLAAQGTAPEHFEVQWASLTCLSDCVFFRPQNFDQHWTGRTSETLPKNHLKYMQCLIYACIWILDSLNPSCNLSEPYLEHILVWVLFIIVTIYCKIGIKMWILLSALRAAGVPWDSEWMVAIRRLCQNQYLLGLHVPCLQELI